MKHFNKFITVVIYFFIIFIANNNQCLAYGESVSVSCGSVSAVTSWPRNIFKASCTAVVTGISSGTTYKLGIYTSNYTTTKIGSGHGSNLSYNSPVDSSDFLHPNGTYRFQVDGPKQGRSGTTSVNITTNSGKNGVTVFQDQFSGVTAKTVDFDLYYRTYEADYGGTEYNQNFIVGLYGGRNGGLILSSSPASPLDFTIANKNYLAVSGPLSNTLSSSDIFPFNSLNDIDSNTITISVKANNTWRLQTLLAGNLISGSNNIPVSSNYFRATGSGFSNLASSKTQFANANNYYNIAQNTSGVYTTGTSDHINLSSINISIIYNVRTTSIFSSGAYTNTTTFNLLSP